MGDNRIPDNIFKLAVEKAREIETSLFEKRFKDTDKHTFSEKYLERMQVLKMGEPEENESKIADYSVKKKSTKVKILLIAAIVMLLGALTVAAEPIREFVYQIKETVLPEYTNVFFESINSNMEGYENKDYFIVRKPAYIPDGYEISEEVKDEDKYEYTVILTNSENEKITYKQKPVTLKESMLEELSEWEKEEAMYEDEIPRYFFKGKDGQKIVCLEVGKYLYIAEGRMEFEELESIAGNRTMDVPKEVYPKKMKIVPRDYIWFDEEDWVEWGFYDYMQRFYHSEKGDILYTQRIIEDVSVAGMMITSDGTEAEDIAVCGEAAKLITGEQGYRTIVYTRGEFVYTIGGYEDNEILVECLETIFQEEIKYDKNLFETIGELTEVVFEAEEDSVQSFCFNLYADGGTLRIASKQIEDYNTDCQYEYIYEDENIGECMFNSENVEYVSKIDREGYKLTGWNVYEGTHVMDIGRDEEYDLEDDMEIFSLGEYMICIMENVELIAENISTDELKKIECTGKDFYVIANWEKVE